MWTKKTCVFHTNLTFVIKNHHRRPKSPKSLQISLGGRKKCDFWWFLSTFGRPKCTKNHKKRANKTSKKRLLFGVAFRVIWGYLGWSFSSFVDTFSTPESKPTKNLPRGDSYSKNHTTLKVRPPKKNSKINPKPFKSQPKNTRETEDCKKCVLGAFWAQFWLQNGGRFREKARLWKRAMRLTQRLPASQTPKLSIH